MSDIAKRLRDAARHPYMDNTCKVRTYEAIEAADEIERLRAGIDQIKIEAATEISFQREQAEKLRQLNCNLIRKDECDELRAYNAKLRAALKPFAVVANHIVTGTSDETICPDVEFTAGELRAAAAALKETGDE